MTDLYRHLIPGYPVFKVYEDITGDAPFHIKVRDAALAGATSALHTIFYTHHALRILEHSMTSGKYWQRKQYGHSSGGWRGIRSLVRSSPYIAAGTAIAIALHFIPPSKPGSYMYEQRMQIADRLFNNPHYS